MAESKQAIKSGYPLPVYNYRVTIQDDSDSLVLSFVEVSGLSVQYEPITYKHGLSYTSGSHIIPGMRQPIRITMRQGMTQNRDYLLKWLKDVYENPEAAHKKRNILIDLCDEAGVAVIRWTVDRAMPVKMDSPTMNANSQEVAVAVLELVAHNLQMRYLNAAESGQAVIL